MTAAIFVYKGLIPVVYRMLTLFLSFYGSMLWMDIWRFVGKSLPLSRYNNGYKEVMESKIEKKKEEALDRLRLAQERKRACLARLEDSMRKAYKQRTGKEATDFFAL